MKQTMMMVMVMVVVVDSLGKWLAGWLAD